MLLLAPWLAQSGHVRTGRLGRWAETGADHPHEVATSEDPGLIERPPGMLGSRSSAGEVSRIRNHVLVLRVPSARWLPVRPRVSLYSPSPATQEEVRRPARVEYRA